jgi:hypothetical protein
MVGCLRSFFNGGAVRFFSRSKQRLFWQALHDIFCSVFLRVEKIFLDRDERETSASHKGAPAARLSAGLSAD